MKYNKISLVNSENEEFLSIREFHFEVSLMNLLTMANCPQIVPLIGYSDQQPNLAVVMKLCDAPLDALIFHKSKKLSMREKLLFALDIATGMAVIHLLDVVHLDLKPANVLVDFKDPVLGRNVARITDFGFATPIDVDKRSVKGLELSRVIGMTTAYAAPEVKLTTSRKKL